MTDAAPHGLGTVKITDIYFHIFALGDVFREDHDASDLSFGIEPRPYFPSYPLFRTVGPFKEVGFRPHDFAGQPAAMHILPLVLNFRENLVVRKSPDFPLAETLVFQPAAAHLQIPHIPIKHRQGNRRVFDEEPQMLLVLPQSLLCLFYVFNVGAGAKPFQDISV